MDCQVSRPLEVATFPWAKVETAITRTDRAVVGNEKGDIVRVIASELFGVLTESKTLTAMGSTFTESYAKVDIRKQIERSTTFYDPDHVPSAAGDKIYYDPATGRLTSVTSQMIECGIFLGLDAAGVHFMFK